jgi:hypothetical protein
MFVLPPLPPISMLMGVQDKTAQRSTFISQTVALGVHSATTLKSEGAWGRSFLQNRPDDFYFADTGRAFKACDSGYNEHNLCSARGDPCLSSFLVLVGTARGDPCISRFLVLVETLARVLTNTNNLEMHKSPRAPTTQRCKGPIFKFWCPPFPSQFQYTKFGVGACLKPEDPWRPAGSRLQPSGPKSLSRKLTIGDLEASWGQMQFSVFLRLLQRRRF